MTKIKKMNFVLAAVLLGVFVASFMSFRATSSIRNRGNSRKCELALERIVDIVQDVDASVRGYILSKDETFLRQYYTATSALETAVIDANLEYKDASPAQAQQLREAEDIARERIAETDHTLILSKEAGQRQAVAQILANMKKDTGGRLRELVSKMEVYQENLVETRWEEKQSKLNFIISGILLAGLSAIGLVIFTFFIVNSQFKQLVEAKETAQNSSKIKSQFLANMSHEIRTPLNGIIGMIGLLQKTTLSTKQREQTQIIETSGQILLTVINDILDLSKIESGKLELEEIDFDLYKLTQNQIDLLSPQAKAKKVSLLMSVDPTIPPLFVGDPNRLSQILLNLIGNAVKFTENGNVIVNVGVERRDSQKISVKFKVTDTGIGIAEPLLPGLFQPFTQADGSTSRRYGGTGLGLSIAKRLVDIMGGEIGAESLPGSGSTFWFSIPLQISQSTHLAASVPAQIRTAQLPNGSILVAEDNPINQKVVISQLEALGYKAKAVSNGQDAVNAMTSGQFDLILMDCQMPVVDGFEATRLIRKIEAITGEHRPIIALTANAGKDDRERCLAAGMDDYLSKPFKIEALSDLLRIHLSVAQQRPA